MSADRRNTLYFSGRVWIVLVLACAVLIALLLRQGGTESRKQEPVSRSVEEPRRAEIAPVVADAPMPVVPIPCKQQQIELTLQGRTRTVCVGEINTVQNGSVRAYRVEATHAPLYWLRIEATGSAIVSASLGTRSTPDFHCIGNQCKGITIGKHDAEGARVISLDRTALMHVLADGSVASDNVAGVSGKLKTLPEHLLPALACTDQGVSIITSDGSSISFCPKGGAGFETGDEGNRTYRFTSLDGESILVAVDPGHLVKQVEYQGESTLACKSSACRVGISPPNSAGERIFTFAGTTLLETSRGERNAVLNGTLLVPPL